MTNDILGDFSGSVLNPTGLSIEFSSYFGKAVAKKVYNMIKSYNFVKILRPSIRMFIYLSPLGIIINFKLNCSESLASACIVMISDDFTFIGHFIGHIIACLKASRKSETS
jgi:hypothetical protein